jgi:hypothetical protein
MGRMAQFRYSDFLTELRAGKLHGVFIDDTGSPGLSNSALHPERKSWVAVVVSPGHVAEVLRQMPGAIRVLQRETGATEFHFADIYAGRKHFKGVDLRLRLAFFRFMADMFIIYRFPVIVQTFDPTNIDDLRRRGLETFPERLGPFNLTKPNDLALLFLLMNVKQFLKKQSAGPGPWARVFVDEGFQKNGAAIPIPTFEGCFADGLVCFAQSHSVYPIQLADFAAYCHNRVQLIIARPKLEPFDKMLVEILSPIAWNFQNVPKFRLDQVFPKKKN